MFINTLRMCCWRAAILAGALAILAATFWWQPEWLTAALAAADAAAEVTARPFSGHAGFIASVLADGTPFLLAGAIGLSGGVLAGLSFQKTVWLALPGMILIPFLAKASKLALAAVGQNDWLIAAGRMTFDQLPRGVRTWGNEIGLEQHLQLIILIVLLTVTIGGCKLAWRLRQAARNFAVL